MSEPQQLVLMDQEHVIHPMHEGPAAGPPAILVKGRGAILTDVDGNEYIDALAGLWNVAAGHGREELAEAGAQQMRELAYYSGYHGFSNIPAIKLADKLAELAPGNLTGTFYTTGGAESNETAFKMARFYWKQMGRHNKVKIISRLDGYHGLTGAALSATGMGIFWRYFDPLQPGFYHIPTHYCFHCSLHKSYPECRVACADTLEQQILAEDPETVAAFIAEPVHGSAGVIPPPPEYFPRIREICNRYDVLFIADEVITGFGRTGKMFGLENWDVACDLMSFAKGVTSAYMPLGGVMVSARIHKLFRELPPGVSFNHGYTYSLHPVCCAVALRNLEIFEKEGLVARAAEMGNRLMRRLKELDSLPGVGEVRGLGLMAAVELAADKKGTSFPADMKAGRKVFAYGKEHGVLFRLRNDSVLMSPPLVITEQQIDTMVNVLGEAIRATIK